MRNEYHCRECNKEYRGWYGLCKECGAWGTIIEKVEISTIIKEISNVKVLRSFECRSDSTVLIYGEPGVGKTTYLFDWCVKLDKKVLYISTEQGYKDFEYMKSRLGVEESTIKLLNKRSALSIADQIMTFDGDIIILDSLQGIQKESNAIKGKRFYQSLIVDECIRCAKEKNIIIILVCYINKKGEVQGPKELEHYVDVVISMRMERNQSRIVALEKNRYGNLNQKTKFIIDDKGALLFNKELFNNG